MVEVFFSDPDFEERGVMGGGGEPIEGIGADGHGSGGPVPIVADEVESGEVQAGGANVISAGQFTIGNDGGVAGVEDGVGVVGDVLGDLIPGVILIGSGEGESGAGGRGIGGVWAFEVDGTNSAHGVADRAVSEGEGGEKNAAGGSEKELWKAVFHGIWGEK